jgi:hypothetical protein
MKFWLYFFSNRQGVLIMTKLESLEQKIAALEVAVQQAVTLIHTLKDEKAAGAASDTKVDQLTTSVDAQTKALQDAITGAAAIADPVHVGQLP